MKRTVYGEEHEAFRQSFRGWLEKQVVPHAEEWDEAGIVPREFFSDAAKYGFVGMAIPEEFGGGGVDDFRFNAVLTEESQRLGVGTPVLGLVAHNDLCTPYLVSYGTPEQARRWLPGVAKGELITAIAMTEPGAGSDLAGIATTAIRDGDHYVVNGAKTFISNGINADLVLTVVKTDPAERHAGISLLVIERGMPGFERGRNLRKLGQHSQDTAELSFNDVRVPVANLLGEEGKGFGYLIANLPQERMATAVSSVAAARAALDWTIDYVRDRKAFGQSIGSFQNTRFRLAEVATEIDVAQAYVDQCLTALVAGELTVEDAAKAKWWTSEVQSRAVDTCLQLHGGYGYMLEYPIARAYADARISRIYAGTTEIMKEIIGRSLKL
jgi:alkylation response protein AidB-like acyl-CoA dehydrogenase